MKHILLFLSLLLSQTIYADQCSQLGGSMDGVPDSFHQNKCKANISFAKGNYRVANEQYKQALSVFFHESPNYDLYLELGHSQCLSGEISAGLESIEKFILMAKADLGHFECPKDKQEYEDAIKSEHMFLACEGFGSPLSIQWRVHFESRLVLADTYRQMCKDA